VVVRCSAAIGIARQPQAANPLTPAAPLDRASSAARRAARRDARPLTGKEVTAALASLVGTDILAILQPRIMHIVTERPIPDTTGLRTIPDAGESRGA
jgi:hypothetical protein